MFYEDLFPSLEALIPDVTDTVYMYGIQRAARTFFKETEVWCRPLEILRISENISEIELEPFEDAIIHSVPLVTVDGNPLESVGLERIRREQRRNGTPAFYHKNGNVLFVAPLPNTRTEFEVQGVSIPAFTSEQVVADDLMEKYSDAIIFLAAATILSMPNKPWTNARASVTYNDMYHNEKLIARREALGYLDKQSHMMDYRENSRGNSDY